MEKEEGKKLQFGLEGLRKEAKRKNFIGTVISAVYPCDCEDCRKGAAKIEGERPDTLHIKMQPLTKYSKVQTLWVTPTDTIFSTWGALNQKLEELDLLEEFKVDGAKVFVGKTFEWEDTELLVGMKPQRELMRWMPIRLVGEDEVKELQGSGDPKLD